MDIGWRVPAVTLDPWVNSPQRAGGHRLSITTYNTFFSPSFFVFSGFSVYIFIPNASSLQLPIRESMQLIHTARLGCILSAFITVFKAEP